MPRDASGNFAFTPSSVAPAVAGTPIDSVDYNAAMNDIAAELQDSLSRSGKGGMDSPFFFDDGTSADPAIAFTAETGTGFFRQGAGQLGMSILGVLKALWEAALITFKTSVKVEGNLEVTGTLTAANIAGGAFQKSASSGAFSYTGGTAAVPIDDGVNPISVSITTVGRPILVGLQPFDATLYKILLTADAGGARTASLKILRDGATIYWTTVAAAASTSTAQALPMFMDTPGAGGPYVYTATVSLSNIAASIDAQNVALVAYEL